MPALTSFTWNPAALNQALLSAYRPSVRQAETYSRSRAHLRSAGVKVRRSPATSLATCADTMMPTGLGWVQEKGREGGYPIFPGGGPGLFKVRGKSAASRGTAFGTDRFYQLKSKGGFSTTSGAIAFNSEGGKSNTGVRYFTFGGDMEADPYIYPGAALWSSQLYKNTCAAILARRGFGKGNVR